MSGSHGTGKSTLIAAFVERRPEYRFEPEAYETLADDVGLTDSEGPTPEGLDALLDHTLSALAQHQPGAHVMFERSPVDYLAYAASTRSGWPRGLPQDFVREWTPRVREAVRRLDLIALVPLSAAIPPASDEDPRFRRRVDEWLRRALVDDDLGLFDGGPPRVVELPAAPDRRLAELIRLAAAETGRRIPSQGASR